jgi:hypothetical protein
LALAANEVTSGVLCRIDGRAPVEVFFARKPDQAVVDLGDVRLRPGTRLRVRVMAEGKPVANASVQVGPCKGTRVLAGAGAADVAHEGHVRTDGDGHADFPSLKCAGRWQVLVQADGFEFHGPSVLEIPEGRATFEAELVVHAAPQADTVAGRIVDVGAQPVAGVALQARPASGRGGLGRTRSQEDGAFRFENLRQSSLGDRIRTSAATS